MAGSTRAQYVPSRWNVRNSMNWGSTSASVGSMMPARIAAIRAVLPRNFRCASEKPIIEHTSTVSTTDTVEITKLLRYHHPIALASQAFEKAPRFQWLDHGVTGWALISLSGRSDVISVQANG